MDEDRRRWAALIIGLLILFTTASIFAVNWNNALNDVDKVGRLTSTPEPIVPTRTLTAVDEDEPSPQETKTPAETRSTVQPRATTVPPTQPAPTVEVKATAVTAIEPLLPVQVSSELARFGATITGSNADGEAAYAEGLPYGSVLSWNVLVTPPEVPAEFWQMVRTDQQGIRTVGWDELAEAIAANPDSYWLVGNEQDVEWQDNVTPERYAAIYHDVYNFIKERDPGAKVVIGGVSQPTPLRRAYLDIVLDTYALTYGESMPIDVWNVHAFTLREEADSWGVGIPPGMEGEEGILYEIEDHDNVEIIAQNVRDFRRWMVERGYGDKPLVVSEYGILMPEDYGFPPQDVAAFMESTFDLFREMAGEDGYAPDDNRLVQWWFWYSIYDPELYSTGNLWDRETGQLTELGQTWSLYITDNNITDGPLITDN